MKLEDLPGYRIDHADSAAWDDQELRNRRADIEQSLDQGVGEELDARLRKELALVVFELEQRRQEDMATSEGMPERPLISPEE